MVLSQVTFALNFYVMRQLGVLLLVLMLASCGGGGSSAPAVTPPVPPTPPPTSITRDDRVNASKFAARASFGMTYAELEALATNGMDAWLDEQFALPIGRHTPTVDEFIARRDDGDFDDFEEDISYLVQFRRWAWWNCAVTCEDTLRQRVAFALSQILVVSDNVDALVVYPGALSSYQDLLLEHAFGNYRDLLYDVTLHPAMGFYLSHINNNRSNPAANTFPDENFAREVMQLFSIGLFELNVDGTRKLDANGQPIATYDNADIREFAKVFTGFSFGGANTVFGGDAIDFRSPMSMFEDNHEPGEKNLLNGFVVPSGQTGLEDVNSAIDNLFNHPNVGPFIGKQLIQRLVTSNPSPVYVQRVAEAFNGRVTGVRGDMKAVLRAVLTDPEATGAPAINFGKLREPVVRYAQLLRTFGATSESGVVINSGYLFQAVTKQHPLSAPSVFNFYLPEHSPAGELAEQELVAPEFEITNSSTIVNFTNFLDAVALTDFVAETPEPFDPVTLDFSEYDELAADIETLIDRLDVEFASGSLSSEFRAVLAEILAELPENEQRRAVGLYMVLTSADYAVQR